MSVKAFFTAVVLLLSVNPKVIAGNNSASVEILYIANTNALLENCHCGNPSLGGLARITTIIKEERKSNPSLIFIDGGDFFNSYPYKELNSSVLKIYSLLKPDIITPGENEFIDGISVIKPFFNKNGNRLVTTNCTIDHLSGRNEITKHGITFLSFLDERLLTGTMKNSVVFNNERFKKRYLKNRKQKLIALYHGYFENVKRFTADYPQIDIILSAHAPAGQIAEYGKTVVIGSGSDGEYVVKILIDAKGTVKAGLLPVGLDIKQDGEAMKFVNAFKEAERSVRSYKK